jgi:nickel transport protein
MRAALTAVLAVSGTLAWAHQLTVFAFVEDGDVVIEAKFSNGRVPVEGVVRVLDAGGAPLATLALGPGGTARFAFDPATGAGGLTIEVETGEGHEDYWILTPEDIARGSGR